MPGVKISLSAQTELLAAISSYFAELEQRELELLLSSGLGPGFSRSDALVLYAMLRHLQPSRIIEVGGGTSTAIIAKAIARNGATSHTVIEPFPSRSLGKLESVQLIKKPVQLVPLEVFSELGAKDFLFVDSTHTVKPGSDVNYIVLEVLPRLAAGVVVHFHDINFPFDHQPDLFQTVYQWSEGSLLRAFLTNNCRAEVMLSMSYLSHHAAETLTRTIPGYCPAPTRNGVFLRPVNEIRSGRWDYGVSTYVRV